MVCYKDDEPASGADRPQANRRRLTWRIEEVMRNGGIAWRPRRGGQCRLCGTNFRPTTEEDLHVPITPSATHPNADAFPAGMSGPALRALANAGIRTVAQVATHSAAEISALHGMGPKGVRLLGDALVATGLRWRAPDIPRSSDAK